MTTGKRIRDRRQELGLSVPELAAKLGKNRATVYRYESDEIESVPANVIRELADALDTTPAYLMCWTNNSTPGAATVEVSNSADPEKLPASNNLVNAPLDGAALGARMAQIRDDKELTLQDVASRVGVAASTIQRYEKGQFSSIKMPVVEAIASALGTTTSYLIGTEAPEPCVKATQPHFSDADIRAAFFRDLDPTFTDTDVDDMWEDVKDYIAYKVWLRQRHV